MDVIKQKVETHKDLKLDVSEKNIKISAINIIDDSKINDNVVTLDSKENMININSIQKPNDIDLSDNEEIKRFEECKISLQKKANAIQDKDLFSLPTFNQDIQNTMSIPSISFSFISQYDFI